MTTEQNKSQPQHTAAPWWKDDHGFIAAGNGDTYVTIADFDCSNDIDIDEREANKNLALAAPELLAALEDVIGGTLDIQGGICQHCGRDYFGDITSGDCPSDDCPAYMARAAIAKARGQQ